MMKKLVLAAYLVSALSLSVSAQTILTVGDDVTAYYLNLEEAFNDINAGTQNGDIVLQIIADCTPQTGTAVLYHSGYTGMGLSDYNSVTIYPVAPGLKVENSIDGPMIELNGADNVVFDGRVNQSGSTPDLLISNTSTDPAASTIRFLESAATNTIRYCILKGAGTGASNGLVEFLTSSTGSGNDGNTISNNLVTSDPAGRPVNAIYSSGSASGKENSGNIISDNSFYDLFNEGVISNIIDFESNSTAWTISGNSFYETAAFIPAATTTLSVININNSSGTGFQVTGNFIGGSSASCGGSAWTKTNAFNNTFYGIRVNAGTAVASSLQANTISNFSWSNPGSAAWTAIDIISGNVNIGTSTGNTIGSATGTGSIVFNGGALGAQLTGINIASNGTVNCRNNNIGSLTLGNASGTNATGFCGIRKTAVAGTTVIDNNTIGSETTSGSIQLTSASTANSQVAEGISSLGTGSVTISNNTVAGISNSTTNATGTLSAVSINGSSAGTVVKNFIHDLAAITNISGINILKGTVVCANNIISVSSNNPAAVSGIYLSGIAADNYSVYYNTVYLGGSPTSGSINSAALTSNTNAETRDIRNNLLVNARSNSGTATGKHYGIYFTSTGGTLTCNYNDYYAPGTGGVAGYYGGDKPALPVVTAQDANSHVLDPVFTGAGGSNYTDYRIANGTLVGGTAVSVTDDYTGLPRAATPTIGALEAGSCSDPVSGGTISLAIASGCNPFDPALITSTGLPSGYIGTLEYKWQYSITGPGSGYNDISSSNSATFNPPSLSASTWYRRLARVACSADWSGAAASNVIAVSVNTPPVAGAITGTSAVCRGTNVTLTPNATGTPTLTYTWLSSNTAVATVNSSGYVTSVSAGTTNITYTVTDGNTPACQATSPVFAFTVNDLPVANPITGDNAVCSNGALTLTSNATGTAPLTYTWSSSDAFVATINNSGVVDPNAEGSTSIRYTVTDGSSTSCSAISAPFALAVKDAPVAGSITGSSSACVGATVNLSSAATGTPVLTYTWSSSNPAVATVTNSGTVTALSGGTTNITYTVTDGNTLHCSATSPAFLFTVNSLPASDLAVGGSGTICSGTSTNITVALSQTGVNYQLRNASGNINIGAPVAGNGGTINLPTGNLTAATSFNILATNATTSCSVQLTGTASVTVDPASAGGTLSGGAATVTYGGSTGTMTLSGNTGTIMLWQKQYNAGAWTDITNTTSAWSENPSAAGTWKYRVKVKSGVCPDAFSTESTTVVTKKDLTITAANQSKTYGALFTFTGSEFNTAGLIGSDAVSSVTLTSAGTAATADLSSSPYSIIPSAASGTGLDNYNISYVNGTLTVNPAALTITAANQSKTYGSSFSFSGNEFTATGLQSWDAVTSVSLSSSGAAASSAVSGSPYSIIPSGATGTGLSNYTISYVNGSLTVNKAPLSITANNRSKTYGQAVTFAGSEFVSSGLLLSDAVSAVSLTCAGSAASAGVSGSPYSIIPSAATGTGLDNYQLSYINGSLTVNKASLTVTADNKTRKYNEANPQFTLTFSGFVNNENQSVINQLPQATTTAGQTSPVGTYPVTVTGGSDDNYTFVYVNGTLTITKQQQEITITDSPEELQVGTSYTLAATSTSGLPVSFESLDTDLATISGTTVTGVRKGKVTIRAFNAGNQNYDPAEEFTEIKIVSSHKDILNLFTPNGDGYNDYWELPLMSEWGRCNVRVFNRWGKLVFSNPDYDNRWDGTSDGTRLPEGPYYFVIETENAGVVKGTVNLVR